MCIRRRDRRVRIACSATAAIAVGGFIGGLFGGDGVSGIMNNPWSLGTILLGIVGAIIVMAIYGFATKGRA